MPRLRRSGGGWPIPAVRRLPKLVERRLRSAFERAEDYQRMSTTETIDLPGRAAAVGTLASEHAAHGDEHGRLADPVVEALHREGLYGMWVPRSLGGAELDPLSSLRVIENLAYGDPSTGWAFMAAALAIGTGAAYLDDSAVDELFAGERLPVIAGQNKIGRAHV